MKEFISDMWNGGVIGKSVLFITLFTILSTPASIHLAIQEEKEWQAFKVEHDCEIVARERWRKSIGYLCDDGITYWR